MDYSDSKYSNKDLLQICKDLGIKCKPKTNKQDMIVLIKHHVASIPASDASIPASDASIPASDASIPAPNATPNPKVEESHIVESKSDTNISREEAEKSATEWCGPCPSLVRDWLVQAIMDKKQHRDIGKHLAMPSEIYVNKWISEKTGRPIKNVTGVSWDGITDDDKPVVRNQIKFRMDAWHFETTRRNSKKNSETNSTGHVAYRKDEFDVVAIFKPSPTFGITGSSIRCIPVSALINPLKPDQLITNISTAIRKEYDNDSKTNEVIKLLYQTHL